MRGVIRGIVIALVTSTSAIAAQPVRWTSYSIAETGTSVDIPASIFTDTAGPADGYGERFQSADGSARLTVQSVPNASQVSPASFLAKKHPPQDILYKRVTSRFFVVSSYRRDNIWYDRCNFSGRFIHCVLLSYPAGQKRDWDPIVTRISHTLSGG
jgi:hypothetical protein